MIDPAHPVPQPDPAPDRDTTAVMGRRIGAWVLDLALYLGLALALFFALSEWTPVPDGFVGDPCAAAESQVGDAASGCAELGDRVYLHSDLDNRVQTALSVVYFAFFVVLQGRTGASPGKFLTGLRVVDERGARAGVLRSLVRTLLWVVDAAPWFLPLVGFIVGLTSTGHRRVGDLAAGTFVVRKRDVGTPPLATATAAPGASWGAPPPAWPPTGPPQTPFPTQTPFPSQPSPTTWEPAPSSVSQHWSWERPVSEPEPDPSEVPDRSEATDAPQVPATPEVPVQASFVAPGSEPSPPVAPSQPVGAAATPAAPPPQWDPARNTYLQWDPNQQRWLQWDGIANRWKLIDT